MSFFTSGTDISYPPAASARKTVYLAETPVLDVMREQLEYLLEHGQDCKHSCPDCRRLEELRRCLLRPFADQHSAKKMVA